MCNVSTHQNEIVSKKVPEIFSVRLIRSCRGKEAARASFGQAKSRKIRSYRARRHAVTSQSYVTGFESP
jgi:hypothetical protein